MEPHLLNFDEQLLLLINGAHCAFLDSWMWLISAKTVWIPFYLLTLYCVYKNRGRRATLEMLILIGVMMLFTDFLNAEVIRPWIQRLRPTNPDNPISSMVHVVNNYRGGPHGFPSAHAANYTGLTFLIAYFMRSRKVLLHLCLLTVLICYSRSYLGVHYPGDLLAGAVYGALVANIIIALHKRYAQHDETKVICWEYVPGGMALASIAVFALISLFA